MVDHIIDIKVTLGLKVFSEMLSVISCSFATSFLAIGNVILMAINGTDIMVPHLQDKS